MKKALDDCTTIVVSVFNVELDSDKTLAAIKFKWWVHGRLDHIYRYQPNYGMTHAWRQYQPGN